MKRYWQFLIVGVICLLAALLWAQPSHKQAQPTPTALMAQPSLHSASSQPQAAAKSTNTKLKDKMAGDNPLPGSSSSLPLLAVIGFGVLAGGITSAMRTRE